MKTMLDTTIGPTTQRLLQKLRANPVVGFTGSIAAGKDHTAERLNAVVHSFAAPLYALTKFFFGYGNVSRGKNFPVGLRECWQTWGQWGKGRVDEDYPLTSERAAFCFMIRDLFSLKEDAQNLLGDDFCVDWAGFGCNDALWADALCKRIERDIQRNGHDSRVRSATNLRFPVEVEHFRTRQWAVVHVLPGMDELKVRQARQGTSPGALANISESLACRLNDVLWTIAGRSTPVPDLDDWLEQNDQGFIDGVVWASHAPKPNPEFLTVDEFSEIVNHALVTK